MTPEKRATMQLVLEALEACVEKFYAMKSTGVIGALPIQAVKAAQAITALREALDQDQDIDCPCGSECIKCSPRVLLAEQVEPSQLAAASLEPVAEVIVRPLRGDQSQPTTDIKWLQQPKTGKLYAAPVRTKDPCNPLQDLTDDEIHKCMNGNFYNALDFARAVIAADRSKNEII